MQDRSVYNEADHVTSATPPLDAKGQEEGEFRRQRHRDPGRLVPVPMTGRFFVPVERRMR